MHRAVFLFAAGLFALVAARDGVDKWVEATDLPPLIPAQSVEMLDQTGTLLRAYTVEDGRYRLGATPAQVDPLYLALLLAHEDQRFAEHAGVDPYAVLRAVSQAIRAGEIVSGASTLTMQVARLLEGSGTGAWSGKLRQVRVALALERQLTKDQILSLYLTLAPFGGNLEGVRAGSLAWLGKEPSRLTPAEAALLVALPQAPEARRPDRFAATAIAARDRVLARGIAAGVLPPEARRITAALPDARRPFPQLAHHLTDRMRRTAPDAASHTLSLNAPLQARLEALAAQTARALGPRLSAAIVVMEVETGLVRASVGSAGTDEARQGFVDMTRAVRSPGSTLKPLVYALAFDAGIGHPETLIEDAPTAFGSYAPQNFDRQFRGTISLRGALQASLNIPVVKLTDALGPAQLIAGLRRAGVSPRLPGGAPGLAVALGGVGVTLEELVTLYGAFARGGKSPSGQVISAEAAWHIGDILRGVPPPANAPLGLAYKTGTSYGHRDAWAIGYDSEYVVGVWLGRPDGTPVPGAFGADVAAPMLFAAFQAVSPDFATPPPPPPATLIASNASLPQPLQRFRGDKTDGVGIAFPPDGAVLARNPSGLVIKLRGGTPPFTLLADGAPIATRLQRRETYLPAPPLGFLSLSVIDAFGQSSRVSVELR